MEEDPMTSIHHAFSKLSYESPDVQREYARDLGYERDDELSGRNHAVFHNPSTKNTVLAFRGTQDVADLPVDGLTLLNMGSHSERYKNAGRVARQVVARYGSEGTSTTGHSLGGAVAVHVNRETGLKSTAFNPLSSLGGKVSGAIERTFCDTVGAATARCKNARNSTIYKVGNDPVAMQYRGADKAVVRVRQKTRNPHSLDNF
jgi:hypothetical protein